MLLSHKVNKNNLISKIIYSPLQFEKFLLNISTAQPTRATHNLLFSAECCNFGTSFFIIITKMKIAVYCSATDNLPAHWQESARIVGEWIGRHNAQLIYGGVDAGLMTITARACRKAGGTVVGVIPPRRRALASPLNNVCINAPDLNERKSTMQLLSDLFVVLPGGYGTLDELINAFSYINFTQQLGKYVIVYNADGLYNHFLAQLEVMVEHGLMPPQLLNTLKVVDTLDKLSATLDQFTSQPQISTL